eukprot:6152550-Ditylum_brightwellii.AAC.1
MLSGGLSNRFHVLTTNAYVDGNLELEVSREASNKSEEAEHGDEKELETVSTESKGIFVNNDIITDCRKIGLALGGTGKSKGGGPTPVSYTHLTLPTN